MLGIVVPDITNPYFGELVEQLERSATEYGHSLVVNLSHGLSISNARASRSSRTVTSTPSSSPRRRTTPNWAH